MQFLKKTVAHSANPNSIGNKFRQKRIAFLESLIEPLPKPIKILDVGGSERFWVNANFHKRKDLEITLLNLSIFTTEHTNMTSVIGDATNLSQYENNSFDLVFSNSVIEHLYTKENQQKMAAETQRVGKFYCIQTPYKYFIIEPHYVLPLFQFVPKKFAYWILTKTNLSRLNKWEPHEAKQYLDEIRLLSKKEMIELYPKGKLWEEKFFGLTKSISAHNLS